MKFFAFIMAFYILALSIVPCSDMQNECNNPKAKTELAHKHDHNQDKDDNCTPFCNCTCCITGVTMFRTKQLIPENIPDLIFSEEIPIHNTSFISDFYGHIWQPPKV